MPLSRSMVVAAGLSLAPLGPLAAQADGGGAPSCPDVHASDSALAARFAPVLRFGPGERDFPVLPFFTAFRGPTSLDTLSNIAAFDSGQTPGLPLASWDSLYAAYRAVPLDRRHRQGSAVFYQVLRIQASDMRDFWRFLQEDPQAWHRWDMDRLWPRELRQRQDFRVIQYYFYYLNDTGLEGHKEDIEFVFVFVPADGELACRFRLTVGAGHDPRTPNNVVVDLIDERDAANPGASRPRTDVLVELGGHASAPYRGPPGPAARFELGRDVNWHAYDVWGTRDILALTGTGFMGRYRPEYTLTREGLDAKVLWPRDATGKGDYMLLPVAPFRTLSRVLDLEPVDSAVVVAALEGVAKKIRAAGGSFTVPGGELTREQMQRMRAWNRALWTGDGRKELGASHHQVWEHRHFRGDPLLILKEHLYPPSLASMESFGDVGTLVTYGIDGYANEAIGLHIGLLVPTVWLPLKLPGFLEVQAGIVARDWVHDWDDGVPGTVAVSVVYERQYRERVGWYGRLGFVRNRAVEVRDPDVSDWTLSGGPSLLLWSDSRRHFDSAKGVPNIIRIRMGPRVDLTNWNRLSERVGFEILLSLRQ